MKIGFLHFTEVTAPSEMVQKRLGFACMRGSTSDKIGNEVGKQKVKRGSVNAGEQYGVQCLSTSTGIVHIVRSNLFIHT